MAPPNPDPVAQGYANGDTGLAGELIFDFEVFAELGGVSEKAKSDSTPYDRTVYFGPKDVAVQVRATHPRAEGEWEFKLVKRKTGLRSDRAQPYRHDADCFALYCLAPGAFNVVERYFIPAMLLEGRTTIRITPGRRRQRLKDGLDPERFRGEWPVLRGEMPAPLPELPKPPKPMGSTKSRRRKATVSPDQTSLPGFGAPFVRT